MIERVRAWIAREAPKRPRLDPTDPEQLARIRRQLDAEALQFYQDPRSGHWMVPTWRWLDWEEAAVAMAAELAQYGVRRVRYLRRETQWLCDHPQRADHDTPYAKALGCREPVEVFVFEVSKRGRLW